MRSAGLNVVAIVRHGQAQGAGVVGIDADRIRAKIRFENRYIGNCELVSRRGQTKFPRTGAPREGEGVGEMAKQMIVK